MDLEQFGIFEDMDLSGISVTVDDCLDQDQACILSVVKMFGKKLSALDIRMQQNQMATHFTFIVQLRKGIITSISS